jgi:hypothetical protein
MTAVQGRLDLLWTHTHHSDATISGDGIGEEVMPEASRMLRAAARRFGFALDFDFTQPAAHSPPTGTTLIYRTYPDRSVVSAGNWPGLHVRGQHRQEPFDSALTERPAFEVVQLTSRPASETACEDRAAPQPSPANTLLHWPCPWEPCWSRTTGQLKRAVDQHLPRGGSCRRRP